MAIARTTALIFRIEPKLKEDLRTAAQQEHRSIANTIARDGGSAVNVGVVVSVVAVLIRDYCKQNDISI